MGRIIEGTIKVLLGLIAVAIVVVVITFFIGRIIA